MFLLFVGVVSANIEHKWSSSEQVLTLTTIDSLTVDTIPAQTIKDINGYRVNYAPESTRFTYDGEDLIIEVDDLAKEDKNYIAFAYINDDTKEMITYTFLPVCSSETEESKCSFKIYLPNEKLATVNKGFKFVSEKDINFKFSASYYNNLFSTKEFYLTANDEFLINEIDGYSVNVEITLKDDNNEVKEEIRICGKNQYAYGGSEIIGLGDNTKFSVNLGLVGEDNSDESICEIDSCEYYGNPNAQGSKVKFWCNTESEYPKFEITELSDLDAKDSYGSKPLKYGDNEWTCDNCVTNDATFKLYPVNEIPVQLIVGKFEKFYSGFLVASEFYIGNDELYKVRPNDGMVYFNDAGSLIMILQGGFINIPAGVGENSKNLELEAGPEYRVTFEDLGSNLYKLNVLDCCRTSPYDGMTPLESGVGSVNFENYGCTPQPEERNRFSGFGKGVFTFSPVEGVCKGSSVTPTIESVEPAAVVIADDEPFATVDVGEIEIGEGCGQTDETQGWDYSCGIRSELDPCFSLVKKSMEGGLWTPNECSNAGDCDISDKKEGFYCCDPDVAAKKPYANPKDNTGMYSTIRWGTATCDRVAATTPVEKNNYVREGDSCNTEGTYACIDENILGECDGTNWNPYGGDSNIYYNYPCDVSKCSSVNPSSNYENCLVVRESEPEISVRETELTESNLINFYYYSDRTDNIGVASDFFGSVYEDYINAYNAYEDLLVCGVEKYTLDVTNSGFTGSQADVFINAFNQLNDRTKCIAGFDEGSIVFSKDSRLISSDYLSTNGCLFSNIELNDYCYLDIDQYPVATTAFSVTCDEQNYCVGEEFNIYANPEDIDSNIPDLKLGRDPYVIFNRFEASDEDIVITRAPSQEQKSFLDWIFKAKLTKKII